MGTAIVERAATLVRKAGRPAIGLGVDVTNEAAYRHEGVRHDFADRCRFVVRPV